jgi:site-specific recombinase XerD
LLEKSNVYILELTKNEKTHLAVRGELRLLIVVSLVLKKDISMNNFYAEIRAILESNANKLSTYTYRTYMSHLHKLQIYKPEVDCSEIKETFVLGYIEFMRSRNNSEGTIYRSLSILRMFVKILIRRHKISIDPMQNISLKRAKSRREFLELNELEKLYYSFRLQASKLNYGEREAIRAFLFSCFTGLRYSDLKNLTLRNVQNGKIRIITQKTGSQIYIPIPKQAMELIYYQDSMRLKDATGTVFHVVNNSTFNKNLRSGSKKLGFQHYLHTHLARHTFATSCITFGMPIEVISKMLGHSNLQTTLIYANYANSVIDREMKKFQLSIPKL